MSSRVTVSALAVLKIAGAESAGISNAGVPTLYVTEVTVLCVYHECARR